MGRLPAPLRIRLRYYALVGGLLLALEALSLEGIVKGQEWSSQSREAFFLAFLVLGGLLICYVLAGAGLGAWWLVRRRWHRGLAWWGIVGLGAGGSLLLLIGFCSLLGLFNASTARYGRTETRYAPATLPRR